MSIVKEILETNYENITINMFIVNLKTDYDAVVNSAKYAFNNGQTEGNVGKLKKIKHDMFGRGGIQLLKKSNLPIIFLMQFDKFAKEPLFLIDKSNKKRKVIESLNNRLLIVLTLLFIRKEIEEFIDKAAKDLKEFSKKMM